MKDKCILCGAETPYEENTHVDMRTCYIEGAGQLCRTCYVDTELKLNEPVIEPRVCIPTKLIADTPNDAELGALVRQAWYESR